MKPFDGALLDALCGEAARVPRRRAHHPIHASHQDPIQRMLIALQPGTYFHPHRHLNPPKWELLLALKGAAAWLGFDDAGQVIGRLEVGALQPSMGLESPEGTWHALVCLAPNTVIFECKPGPFTPVAPEDFAPWAPVEGDPEAVSFLRWMLEAQSGAR